MRDLFVPPLVAGDYGDSEDLDLWRLEHYEQGLQVTAAGAGAILIDDDLAARLCRGERRHED